MSGDGVQNPYDDIALVVSIAVILAALVVIDNEIEALQADVDALQNDVAAIAVLVEAEAILEETGGELTTDGTLQTVYINNAPAGNYEPKTLIIDFANQTVTETVRILVNYRIAPAGPWVIDDREPIVGVPVNAGIRIELHEARYGIWITMEKTVGTNQAYDWQVFYEV